MADLTPMEKKVIRDLFKMDTGYFLDFTNQTFAEVFKDVCDIDIYDEKYAVHGDSKAKRMTAFWEIESNVKVASALREFLKFAKLKDGVNQKLCKAASEIITRLSGPIPNKNTADSIDVNVFQENKIKIFISHRDTHKKQAKKLGEYLEPLGVSCFVAHDSIEPMTLWKDVIHKALASMDAFICFITDNFYKSCWTNQEIGFALAKKVPMYLFSFDKTDPDGFKMDTQAIKTGVSTLIECIKRDFSYRPELKNGLLNNFLSARDGSFDNAKNTFIEIVNMKFTDDEIDEIAKTIVGPARYINQLGVILDDPIRDEHKKKLRTSSATYYRELLDQKILSQHSQKRYHIVKDATKERFYIKDSLNDGI